MKIFLSCLLLSLTICTVNGQDIITDPRTILGREQKKMVIQEITIKDPFLTQQIELLISEQILADSVFRKRGYVTVYLSVLPLNNEDVLRSYQINQQFSNFDDINNDGKFPPFYSWIGGRMVLIRIPVADGFISYHYTRTSKRAFQKKIEPFMAKLMNPPRPRWLKKFRPDEASQLHGGKTIYILRNKPPVVVPSHY